MKKNTRRLILLVVVGGIISILTLNPVSCMLYLFNGSFKVTNKLGSPITVVPVSILHNSNKVHSSYIQMPFPIPLWLNWVNTNLDKFHLPPNATRKITINLDDETYLALLIKYHNQIYINNIANSNDDRIDETIISKSNMVLAPAWITNAFYNRTIIPNASDPIQKYKK